MTHEGSYRYKRTDRHSVTFSYIYVCVQMYGLAAQQPPPPLTSPAKPPAALVFNGKNFSVRSFDKLPKQFRLVASLIPGMEGSWGTVRLHWYPKFFFNHVITLKNFSYILMGQSNKYNLCMLIHHPLFLSLKIPGYFIILIYCRKFAGLDKTNSTAVNESLKSQVYQVLAVAPIEAAMGGT